MCLTRNAAATGLFPIMGLGVRVDSPVHCPPGEIVDQQIRLRLNTFIRPAALPTIHRHRSKALKRLHKAQYWTLSSNAAAGRIKAERHRSVMWGLGRLRGGGGICRRVYADERFRTQGDGAKMGGERTGANVKGWGERVGGGVRRRDCIERFFTRDTCARNRERVSASHVFVSLQSLSIVHPAHPSNPTHI